MRYGVVYMYVVMYLGEVSIEVVSENMEELLCGRLYSMVV